MNYTLRKPCANCPFRNDVDFDLRRRRDIAADIIDRQASFACHKTTCHDDEGNHVPRDKEQHCAGAMILLERIGRPNQMMRIAERIGMYDRTKLDMAAPVYRTRAEFVRGHAYNAPKVPS